MPIDSNGGYLFNNQNINAQYKGDFQDLMNSNATANSSQDQQSINYLMGSPDLISKTAGQVLDSYNFSSQGVHDLIYALDHDTNTTGGATNQDSMVSAFQDAIGDLQNDPNLSSTDKQHFNSALQNIEATNQASHMASPQPGAANHN